MRRWLGLALSLVAFGGCEKEPPHPKAEVVVAAAASLRTVVPEIASSYEKAHPGVRITATFGASGELRQQVVAGAPIDVVAFAGAEPVDDLIGRGLADPATRGVIATNTLVLIGPKGCPRVTFFDAIARPGEGQGRDRRSAERSRRAIREGGAAAAERVGRHRAEARLRERRVRRPRVRASRRGRGGRRLQDGAVGGPDVDLLDELAPGLAPRAEVVVRARHGLARERGSGRLPSSARGRRSAKGARRARVRTA